jgi:hypothetical protein
METNALRKANCQRKNQRADKGKGQSAVVNLLLPSS